jgi:2,3-bisphosphoglycerate-dependent phosphoglycerate mutase
MRGHEDKQKSKDRYLEGLLMLTKVYFVRHAQPVHSYADDRTRPLTEDGIVDSKLVLQTLKDKKIDVFYCSPYKRSLDTIRETADYYEMNIQTDERLREREAGVGGNVRGMFQKRNIEALKNILKENEGKNIVIGTHGTALSSIINYYLPEFGCDDFLRIIDWMPYIVEIDFEGQKFISIHEHAHTEKEFKKDNSATKQ